MQILTGAVDLKSELFLSIYFNLESDPTCTADTGTTSVVDEGESIRLQCTVTYRGRWAPVVTWWDGFGQELPSMNAGRSNRDVRQQVMLSVTDVYDGHSFVCETRFPTNLSEIGDMEASNVLDYEHNCSTSHIIVHCE